jgi:hypothetical protein
VAPSFALRLSSLLSALIAVIGACYLAASAQIDTPESWTLGSDGPGFYDGEGVGSLFIIDYLEGPIVGCDVTAHIPNGLIRQVSLGQLSAGGRSRAGSDLTYWSGAFTADAGGAASLDTTLLVRDQALPDGRRFEDRASPPMRFQIMDIATIPLQCAPPGRYKLTCSGPTAEGCRASRAVKLARYRY